MLKNVPGIGAVLIGEGDLSQELGYPAPVRAQGGARRDGADRRHLQAAQRHRRPSACRSVQRRARDQGRLSLPDVRRAAQLCHAGKGPRLRRDGRNGSAANRPACDGGHFGSIRISPFCSHRCRTTGGTTGADYDHALQSRERCCLRDRFDCGRRWRAGRRLPGTQYRRAAHAQSTAAAPENQCRFAGGTSHAQSAAAAAQSRCRVGLGSNRMLNPQPLPPRMR